MEGNFGLLYLICWPLLGAVICFVLDKKKPELRNDWVDIVLFAELASAVFMVYRFATKGDISFSQDLVFGGGMYLKMDGFRGTFTLTVAILWFMAMVFAKEYFVCPYAREVSGADDGKIGRFQFFGLLVLMAVMGTVLSDNLFTSFVFFEIMSLCSFPWVAHYGTKEDMRAAMTYLIYAVLGGLVTLTGILLLVQKTYTLNYEKMQLLVEVGALRQEDLFVPSLLVIFGFASKAGMYPIHTWLHRSYTAAPAPAAALLSTVLSKVGIIGITIVYARLMLGYYPWGMTILVLGLITMLAGGLYAIFAVDMKKIIAFSSMSHIGYIIVGLGVAAILGRENGLAARGAFLHILNHSAFKMIFFIIIGLVAMEVGRELDLNEIKGWGYHKTFLKVVSAMAVFGISGVPFLSGYVSKTFIHEGLSEYAQMVKEGIFLGGTNSYAFVKSLEILFLVGGGCTLAYMLKIFIPVFLMKPEKEEYKEKGKVSIPVMATLSILSAYIVICGLFPWVTLQKIANGGATFFAAGGMGKFAYFSWESMKGALISLAIGLVLYALAARNIRKNLVPNWFDLETVLYKPLFIYVLPTVGTFFMRILDWCIVGPAYFLRKTVLRDNSIEPKERKEHLKIRYAFTMGNLLSKSVSFGLLMFAAGFLAVLVYLILLMIR